MIQKNQRNKIILGLIGAIGGSILMGLPALAQVTNDNSNDTTRYNGNGLLAPNNDSISPDSDNPGVNQNPANRLTPSNVNQNPDARPTDETGYNGSDSSRSGENMTADEMNQQRMNGTYMSPDNSNRSSFNQTNSSSLLNPCPSIFYEPKYRDTVGIPVGCPATYPGSSPAPVSGQ